MSEKYIRIDIDSMYIILCAIKMNLSRVKFKIRMYNRSPMSPSVNDRQTNRNCPRRGSIAAAQNKCPQLVSLVDLLTRGFQFEVIEKRISLQSDKPDRQPFVLTQREINSESGNFARAVVLEDAILMDRRL